MKKKNSSSICFTYDCLETPKRSDTFFYDYIIPLQKIKYVHTANCSLEIRNNSKEDDDKKSIDQCSSCFNSESDSFNSTSAPSSLIRPVVKLHVVKSFLTTSKLSARSSSLRRNTKNVPHDSTFKNQAPP